MTTSQVRDCTITIAFAGLFFFRQEEEGRPYTVGVLRGVPDHFFRIATEGKTVDVEPFLQKQWSLEVVTDFTGSTRGGAHPRQSGKFDRRNPDSVSAVDCRWMVSFRDLYPDGYTLNEDVLFPEITMPAGEVYTLCRTVPLNYTLGGKPMGLFGPMADITGVNITLEPGDSLVLRTSDGRDIIDPPLEYQAGTTRYIAFLNLPPDGMAGMHDMAGTTHFQNYYLLIPKSFSERYDFQLVGVGKQCSPVDELRALLPGASAMESKIRGHILTPPPYYCGTTGG